MALPAQNRTAKKLDRSFLFVLPDYCTQLPQCTAQTVDVLFSARSCTVERSFPLCSREGFKFSLQNQSQLNSGIMQISIEMSWLTLTVCSSFVWYNLQGSLRTQRLLGTCLVGFFPHFSLLCLCCLPVSICMHVFAWIHTHLLVYLGILSILTRSLIFLKNKSEANILLLSAWKMFKNSFYSVCDGSIQSPACGCLFTERCLWNIA